MMLLQLSRDLLRRLPEWEAPLKWSLALAVILLVFLLLLAFGGPDALRFPARIGAFGTLLTLQLLFLWGNRRALSPYHQAQQLFIAGEYSQAREILEALPAGGRESVDALVLLGNCYRHLGKFDDCRRALARALELKPRHHLALYSRGLLALVSGEYAQAAAFIKRAQAAGAPASVSFELGQCHFLLGDTEQAREHFQAARASLALEPAKRRLLGYYLGEHQEEPNREALPRDAALRHWRAEAAKYAPSPYSAHLRSAIDWLAHAG